MFKVLITGSTGFVGKNLIEKLLLKKHSVYEAFFDKEKKQIDQVKKLNNKKNEPLINFENLEKIDCLIHCAAKLPNYNKETNYSLNEYRRINNDLTLFAAKQALNKGIKRFISISTILADDFFIKKNNLKTSRDFYSLSKAESDNNLMEFSRKTGLDIIIIRPPLIYGKFVKGNFLTLLNLINKKIPLPFKSINKLRSYCGVNNLIDLIVTCINHPKASRKIFNVTDDEDISINDLIIKISKYMHLSPILFSVPLSILEFFGKFFIGSDGVKNLTENMHIDISYTRKILNWTPLFNIDENLKETVDWYLKER